MKLFRKLTSFLKNTLCYKTYDLFKWIYTYLKDRYYISDTLYSKELKFVLDQYLHTSIKTDWLGRLYGIVNPAINSNGEFDISNMIIELDGDNTNNYEYIKQWTYKQMKLIAQLFKIERLYDYINIEFTHVGPENLDNYLIVFDIISRKQCVRVLKRFIKHILLYILFILILFAFYYYNI